MTERNWRRPNAPRMRGDPSGKIEVDNKPWERPKEEVYNPYNLSEEALFFRDKHPQPPDTK